MSGVPPPPPPKPPLPRPPAAAAAEAARAGDAGADAAAAAEAAAAAGCRVAAAAAAAAEAALAANGVVGAAAAVEAAAVAPVGPGRGPGTAAESAAAAAVAAEAAAGAALGVVVGERAALGRKATAVVEHRPARPQAAVRLRSAAVAAGGQAARQRQVVQRQRGVRGHGEQPHRAAAVDGHAGRRAVIVMLAVPPITNAVWLNTPTEVGSVSRVAVQVDGLGGAEDGRIEGDGVGSRRRAMAWLSTSRRSPQRLSSLPGGAGRGARVVAQHVDREVGGRREVNSKAPRSGGCVRVRPR